MRCIHCTFSGTSIEIRDHQKSCSPWKAVVEARENGTLRKAKRLRKEILGVEIKPMPEELKERYRQQESRGISEARKRMKKLKEQELRELMKPANVRRVR